MTSLNRLLETTGKTLLCGVPEGLDGLAVGDYARALGAQRKGPVLYVMRDDQRLAATEEALSFFAPDLTVYRLPAWDCLPYDRVSPRPISLPNGFRRSPGSPRAIGRTSSSPPSTPCCSGFPTRR